MSTLWKDRTAVPELWMSTDSTSMSGTIWVSWYIILHTVPEATAKATV